MATRLTILSFLFIAWSQINAQTYDEVSVGASYSQQAYYTLSTGAVKTVKNDAWDIAFSNIGQTDGGVFINESAALSGTAVNLFLAPSNDWSAAITDVSALVDSVKIFNEELNWSEGAFNTVKDPNNPFDYGWGAYSAQSHQVVGDKVFVFQKRNGSFLKLQISALKGGFYHFKYADLDGSNEVQDSVQKSTNGVNSIVHYSFETKAVVNIANDYDIVFQRYFAPLDAGGGQILEYGVTGVLLAPGTQAVMVDGVDVTTVQEADYASQYTSLPTVLGHDWKVFDFTAGWIIDEDRTNFVKTKDGSKYQITFVDFTGSGTGTTTVEKTLLETASVNPPEAVGQTVSVFPNPAKDILIINTKTTENVAVQIFNNLGQNVYNTTFNTNSSISLPQNFTNGVYHLVLNAKNWTKAHSFIVVN